jgi:ribosome maturation factor RimP
MTSDAEFLSRIRSLAEPVANREGCEIYDIEWVSGSAGRGRTLRVYIDKTGGVNLEDCQNVSRGLNLILDVDDAIPGSSYSLEVSSPGLERVLREPRHFSSAIGSMIHVRLREPKENLRAFKARLVAVEAREKLGDSAPSSDEETILVFDLDNKKQLRANVGDIARARVVFVEEKGSKERPGQRKS